MPPKPEFRIRLNGVWVPEIDVRRGPDGGKELTVKLIELGWIVVDDRPDLILEYRDETAWALLPIENLPNVAGQGLEPRDSAGAY